MFYHYKDDITEIDIPEFYQSVLTLDPRMFELLNFIKNFMFFF